MSIWIPLSFTTRPFARSDTTSFFYTNGMPKKGTHLESFVNLYKTEEGRRIVEDTGFVPVAL